MVAEADSDGPWVRAIVEMIASANGMTVEHMMRDLHRPDMSEN